MTYTQLPGLGQAVLKMEDKPPPNFDVDCDEYIVARIGQALRRQKQTHTWIAISEKILEVNGGEGNATIDRRTLSALCRADKFDTVKLSIAQLIALDKYFDYLGAGALFARNRNLLDAIAESSTITFYVAEKNFSARYANAVSADDLKAITMLLRTRLSHLNIKLANVSGPADLRKGKVANERIANVVIASPIANPASDAFMTNMLGLDKAKAVSIDMLPFFFVRRPGEKTVPSKFVRIKLDAVKRDADAANEITRGRRAVVIEDQVFVDSDKTDYALLVAQRNPKGGHVRTVLAGLSGRGTLELAKILRAGGPRIELPHVRKKEKHPPILVAVYKLTIEGPLKENAPDTRPVAGYTAVYGPKFLNYSDGVWRSPADTSETD